MEGEMSKKKKEKKRKENSNERKKKKKESRFLSCRGREFIHEIHESSNRPKMVSNRNCVFKLACGSSARACGRTEWARMRQGRVRVCSSAYMRVKCVCVGLQYGHGNKRILYYNLQKSFARSDSYSVRIQIVNISNVNYIL